MKTVTKLGIAVSLFGAIISQPSLAQVGGLGGIRGNVGQSIGSNLNKNRFGTTIKQLQACSDPSVTNISFRVISRTSRYQGRVSINATVKNVGLGEFVSRSGQQGVSLYEIVWGTRPRLVASRNFQQLRVGQEVNVVYSRAWYSASPAEGEFPPSYRAVIDYDPDIYIDGNKQNDDCNRSNNTREESGAAINRLFG